MKRRKEIVGMSWKLRGEKMSWNDKAHKQKEFGGLGMQKKKKKVNCFIKNNPPMGRGGVRLQHTACQCICEYWSSVIGIAGKHLQIA